MPATFASEDDWLAVLMVDGDVGTDELGRSMSELDRASVTEVDCAVSDAEDVCGETEEVDGECEVREMGPFDAAEVEEVSVGVTDEAPINDELSEVPPERKFDDSEAI